MHLEKHRPTGGHIRQLDNVSGRALERGKRCGGRARTTCRSQGIRKGEHFSRQASIKGPKDKVLSGTRPSKSSRGRLSCNALVRLQWYPCPATVSNNGGSSERSSEGWNSRSAVPTAVQSCRPCLGE